MSPPRVDTTSVAMFCTAPIEASWRKQACDSAHAHDQHDPANTLQLVGDVDCAGWSMQQVAEWAVAHLPARENITSRSYVVADDKSVTTNSLVIVSLTFSSFEESNTVCIENTFRSDPSWCCVLPSLFHSDTQGYEQYAPDDPETILHPFGRGQEC